MSYPCGDLMKFLFCLYSCYVIYIKIVSLDQLSYETICDSIPLGTVLIQNDLTIFVQIFLRNILKLDLLKYISTFNLIDDLIFLGLLLT